MVREDEVHAAAVDVEMGTQVLAAHGGALAVPAWETVAPWAGPSHDVLGLCLLPQGKVSLTTLLAHPVQLARSVLHLVEVTAGEDAVLVVTVILLHVEIDRAVALIGIAVVQYLLHQLLLLDDVSGGVRLDAGRQAVQGSHCLVEAVGIVLGHLHRLQLLEACLLGYLVLALVGIVFQMAYVGDVAHIAHLVTDMPQVAEEEIESDGGTCVSQMGIAIDRRTADIHAHTPFVQGTEELLAARERVIN